MKNAEVHAKRINELEGGARPLFDGELDMARGALAQALAVEAASAECGGMPHPDEPAYPDWVRRYEERLVGGG